MIEAGNRLSLPVASDREGRVDAVLKRVSSRAKLLAAAICRATDRAVAAIWLPTHSNMADECYQATEALNDDRAALGDDCLPLRPVQSLREDFGAPAARSTAL